MPEVPQRVGSRKYRIHPGPRALARGSPKHKAKTSAEAQHKSRPGDTELAAQVEAKSSCLGDRGGRRGAGQQGQQWARPKAELASSPSTPTEGTVQPPGSMTLRVSVPPKGQEVPD